MKRCYWLFLVCLIPTFFFSFRYVKGANTDESADLKKITAEIIEALNTQNYCVLSKYPNANFTEMPEDNSEYLTMYCANDGVPPPKYNYKLDYVNVTNYENSAVVICYLSGKITYYNRVVEGRWRTSFFWIKQQGQWKVVHAHWSKLNLVQFQYFVQLPKDYDPHSTQKWPLILFLHGGGERGNYLPLVKGLTERNGIPKIAAHTPNFPFIVVSPQCPADTSWGQQPEAINQLIDELLQKYQADPDRIYLTGLSIGGVGAWTLAMAHPERFAAIAPVCGAGSLSQVEQLKNVPVWAFHGDKDPEVPFDADQALVDALKAAGGDVRFTVYHGAGHNVWDETYDNPELYSWFLKHTRKH